MLKHRTVEQTDIPELSWFIHDVSSLLLKLRIPVNNGRLQFFIQQTVQQGNYSCSILVMHMIPHAISMKQTVEWSSVNSNRAFGKVLFESRQLSSFPSSQKEFCRAGLKAPTAFSSRVNFCTPTLDLKTVWISPTSLSENIKVYSVVCSNKLSKY